MKNINLTMVMLFMLAITTIFACKDDDDDMMQEPDFSGTYILADQIARPAINTVFVSSTRKDEFNMTIPSNQGAAFQADFEARLLALNAGYTTNALGWDAPTFSGALATDVLTTSLTGSTAFGTLTGRQLADDVIDTELTLIFGGPDGTANAGLTSDNVDANDKAFNTSFPYLATPW